jgi:hypothetical protein
VFRRQLIILFLIGCNAKGTGVTPQDGGVSDPMDGGVVEPDGLPPVVQSSKSRLTFAGGALYASALSEGLGIPRDELCKELGLYDCVEDVHRIALLEVEPYRTGILEPLENTIVSTPIAVERVALAACMRWAEGATGDRPEIVTSLYRRLLQRDPDPRELEHLEEMYAAMGGAPEQDRTWAAMSCFAVATTMEALFY